MPRTGQQEKKTRSEIEKLQEKTIEKFFELSPKMMEHIRRSMEAVMICSHCSEKEGFHQPGKAKDEEGKCGFCHGTYLVPDLEQRNWAFNQAGLRVAPAPKALETQASENATKDEVERQVEKLPKDVLETLAKLLSGQESAITSQ